METKTSLNNVATMRKALETLDDSIFFDTDDHGYHVYLDGKDPSDVIAAALTAPPRNCDRFNSGDVKKDAQAALEAYLAEGITGDRAIAEWMLSPITKGGSGETKD